MRQTKDVIGEKVKCLDKMVENLDVAALKKKMSELNYLARKQVAIDRIVKTYGLEKWTEYISPGVDTRKVHLKFEKEEDFANFLRGYKEYGKKDIIVSNEKAIPIIEKVYGHQYQQKKREALKKIVSTYGLEKWQSHISPGVKGKINLGFICEEDLGKFLKDLISNN